MKLGKYDKERIVKAALDEVFTEREKALVARWDTLFMQILDVNLGDFKKKFEALPRNFFPSVCRIYAEIGGRRVSIESSKAHPVPERLDNYQAAGVFDANTVIAKTYEELTDDVKTLREQREALRVQLVALVNRHNTDKALIAAWPEAVKYLPPVAAPIQLPAIDVAEINRLMTTMKKAA